MLLGHAAGSIGSISYVRLKGQQVSKAKISGNLSKTYRQTLRRVMIKAPSQFAKVAKDNFFRFSFANKTVKQSDYNVFTKRNVNTIPMYLTKQMTESGRTYLAPYRMTQGKTAELEGGWYTMTVGDHAGYDVYYIATTPSTTVTQTWGDFCQQWLAVNPQLRDGDQITIVCYVIYDYWSYVTGTFGDLKEGKWLSTKLVIDTRSNILAIDYLSRCNCAYNALAGGIIFEWWEQLVDMPTDPSTCGMGALSVISRYEAGRVSVGTSTLHLNDPATNGYAYLSSEDARDAAVESYEPTTVTQGEVANDKLVATVSRINIKYDDSATTTPNWKNETIWDGSIWRTNFFKTANSTFKIYGKNFTNEDVYIDYDDEDGVNHVWGGKLVDFFESVTISNTLISCNVEPDSIALGITYIHLIRFVESGTKLKFEPQRYTR